MSGTDRDRAERQRALALLRRVQQEQEQKVAAKATDRVDDLVTPRDRHAVSVVLAGQMDGGTEPEPEEICDGMTPAITTEWLPGPIRAWCDAVCEAYRVPAVMPVAAALCACAAVLQGRTRVKVKDGWEEPLSLWWLVFVRTGGHKSDIMTPAMSALRAWQRERRRELSECEARAKLERLRVEAQLRRLRAQKKGSKWAEGYQDWLGEIRELEHDLLELAPQVEPSLFHSNINPSNYAKIMRQNYECDGIARMSIIDDEGGAIENMLGRYQGVPILEEALKAYGGHWASVVRSSKTGDGVVEIELPHAFMTLCVFAQPHYHDRIADTSVLSTSGFVARCLIDQVDTEDVPWSAPRIPDHIQEAYDECLLTLAQKDVPELVDLTTEPETQAALERCYEQTLGVGVGAARRAVGRTARLVAITEVVKALFPAGGQMATGGDLATAPPVVGVDSSSRARTKKIETVFSYTFLQRLPTLRHIDQPADSLATLTHYLSHRALALPVASRHLANGRLEFSLRDLRRNSRLNGKMPTARAVYESVEELVERANWWWDEKSQTRIRGRVQYTRVSCPAARPAVTPVPDPGEDWDRGAQ